MINNNITLSKWWFRFKKVAKKLMPLLFIWLFVNITVAYIIFVGTELSKSPTYFRYNIISFTLIWWSIYWFLLCALPFSKTFYKEEMNHKKGYYTMCKNHDRVLRKAQKFSHKLEMRKLQVKDYSDFIDKLIAEGRLTKEERLSGAITKKHNEYARIVQANKTKKQ
jgi:hypothetical protein